MSAMPIWHCGWCGDTTELLSPPANKCAARSNGLHRWQQVPDVTTSRPSPAPAPPGGDDTARPTVYAGPSTVPATCTCTMPPYGDGPDQDCPEHGDVRWYATWLREALAARDAAVAEAARLRADVEAARDEGDRWHDAFLHTEANESHLTGEVLRLRAALGRVEALLPLLYPDEMTPTALRQLNAAVSDVGEGCDR